MAACDGDERQIWTCDKMGHLTLLGHRLYLSAKPESKKVFVSKGNDKFSKWKTTLNVPICKGRIPATEHGEPIRTQEMDVTQHVIEETKPGARTFTASPGKTNFSTWSPGTNLTFSSTESQRVYVTPNGRNNQLFFSKKENVFETQYQYQQGGSNWKMAMLVLSPFTFILGMVILVLNIRVNKRRKLESLSHRPKSVHDRFSTYEPCPGTEKGETAGQNPNSSTSRHGEILIEWKDGTIAPLYDQPMN
ncbi:hypothetical protein GDO86_018268 [Hymenochirus boettgeri]|uniref:Uncharacterized protein n=1 Tax=Hymenochirus boettgeri TaxID=247094 RepID=A0A8T2IDV4_9PIPI|nr:hypothetical protein GDO86_018268 [Hymenochirus boettgeri]